MTMRDLLDRCGRKPTSGSCDDDPRSILEKMRLEGSEVPVFALDYGTLRYVHFGALLALSEQQTPPMETIGADGCVQRSVFPTVGHPDPLAVQSPANKG